MKINLKNTALSILIALSIAGCSDEKINPGVEKSVSGGEMAAQESWNSKYLFYGDKGRLSAILYADHIVVYSERGMTFLEKMKVDFYDSTQNITTRLTADNGRRDLNLNKIFAIGNVIAVNDSGTTLKTEELVWRNKDQKIVTDKFVTVTSKKENLTGYGFESDQHIRNWTVFKPILNTVVNEDKNKK